jgi:hypothetical protein
MILRAPKRRMMMNQKKMSKRKEASTKMSKRRTAPARRLGAPAQGIWKKSYNKKGNGDSSLTGTAEAGYSEQEDIWGGR